MSITAARLSAMRSDAQKVHRLSASITDLEGRLGARREEASELHRELERRTKQSSRAAGKGLAGLFFSVTGKKEERIKELQGIIEETSAALGEADGFIAQAEKELDSLKDTRAGFGDAVEKYEQAFEEAKSAVRQISAENEEFISGCEKEMSEADAAIKEIDESYALGITALEQITYIQDRLDSAANFGTWDLMGAGAVSGLAKHSDLDDAQNKGNELVKTLNGYRAELADVEIDNEINVQIKGLMKFADFFLDGLFADLAVLERIHKSQEDVRTLREKVELVQLRLDSMRRADADKKENALNRLADFVIAACD